MIFLILQLSMNYTLTICSSIKVKPKVYRNKCKCKWHLQIHSQNIINYIEISLKILKIKLLVNSSIPLKHNKYKTNKDN